MHSGRMHRCHVSILSINQHNGPREWATLGWTKCEFSCRRPDPLRPRAGGWFRKASCGIPTSTTAIFAKQEDARAGKAADNIKLTSMGEDKEPPMSKLRYLVPELSPRRHKGQAGKLGIVGGCKEYTGAPFFASISALKLGCDISHVFCSDEAAPIIKGYSPELIVHPYLIGSPPAVDPLGNDLPQMQPGSPQWTKVVEHSAGLVANWFTRLNGLVIGPGLGQDPLLADTVKLILQRAREAGLPLVIDADGLSLVAKDPTLVAGYRNCVLTPNVNEFKRLLDASVTSSGIADAPQVGGEKGKNTEPVVKSLAASLGGCTIVQKGAPDVITDGTVVLYCSSFGSPRRCGGQGDVLAGSIAVFLFWALQQQQAAQEQGAAETSAEIDQPAPVLAAYAGCVLTRHAASLAFDKHKRSMTTVDVIAELGTSCETFFPVGKL
eukprot:jgi/Mesvir1/3352/Mv06740-RA.1